MNIVMPCLEKCLDIFGSNKHQKKNEMIRKYKTVDITPPIEDNTSTSQLQQSIPKSYTEIVGEKIFIPPSIEDQTNNKKPGNLQLKQCKKSSFIIMRSLENVYIDNCKNCQAFIGPCFSTVFIRNCQKVKIRVLAQQLRIQNSSNITIQGVVGVKPVLEDCKLIKFCSLSCRIYEDLVWQIQTTKINLFDNQVYECYDFTPKKNPNFVNFQKQQKCNSDDSISQIKQDDFQTMWEDKIQQNELDWGLKNVYLPSFTTTKKSMLLKTYPQPQIRSNSKILLIYTRMLLKQFLTSLSCPQLLKNYQIILNLSAQSCLKQLRSYGNYKEKINSLLQKTGNWYFLLIKVKRSVNMAGIGIGVVDDRDLVWRLFKEEFQDQD